VREHNEKVIVIEIPMLPPKEASPNWRGHWTARYRAMEVYKTITILSARQRHPIQPITTATIRTTLVVKDRRYRADPDNAIASLKAAIDGIVAAGILTDDKYIKVLPVVFDIDKERAPMTILEIEATNSNDQS